MKIKNDFDLYLADLAVMTFKLHNLHWNVVGHEFMSIHKFTEMLYETTFEYYDAVAEHQKMFDSMPECRVSEFAKNATIKELEPKTFKADEVFEILKEDIEILKENAKKLREGCDNENWFSAVSLLEDQIDFYNKQLWFIEASLA